MKYLAPYLFAASMTLSSGAASQGIDPFSIEPTPYEELTEDQRQYADDFYSGKIRHPGSAPGAAIVSRYAGKRSSRPSMCFFGIDLGRLLTGCR